MSSYPTNRTIALALACLRVRLRSTSTDTQRKVGARGEGRVRLSVDKLAKLLTKAQDATGKRYVFTRKRTNDLINGVAELSSADETNIFSAVQALVDTVEPPFALSDRFPDWLEREFASELPEFIRTPWPAKDDSLTTLIGGAPLGRLTGTLQGTWRCFYIRPLPQLHETHIQGFILRFRPADATSMHVEFAGHDRHMIGLAYLLNVHLYLFLRDQKDENVSMLLLNAPTDHFTGFSGTGTGLVRPAIGQYLPSAAAFVCFGQKWAHTPEEGTALDDIFNAMKAGAKMQEPLDAFYQEQCRKLYKSVDQFKTEHPLLHDYIQKHHINGNEGLSPNAIFLNYP